MLSPYEPYEPMEQCGVAIITPLEHAWPEYLTMIRGTAHDMMIIPAVQQYRHYVL